MEMYGRQDIKLHAFSIMALDGGEGSASCFSPQYPLERRLDGYESQSGYGSKEENTCPTWNQTLRKTAYRKIM
jgi:hypothetical protein